MADPTSVVVAGSLASEPCYWDKHALGALP